MIVTAAKFHGLFNFLEAMIYKWEHLEHIHKTATFYTASFQQYEIAKYATYSYQR